MAVCPSQKLPEPRCPAKARQRRQRKDSIPRVPAGTVAVQLNTNSHAVVQLLSQVRLFATLWTAAHQASLSFTISQSLLRLMSTVSMMSSNHLIRYSVQLLSRVRLFATPWAAARQASLSIANSWSLLKLMSIELVIPPSHLIFCCPLFLLPSIFPSIRVFSTESAFRIRWPKYWSFSLSINPSNEYSGLIAFKTDWLPMNPPKICKVA